MIVGIYKWNKISTHRTYCVFIVPMEMKSSQLCSLHSCIEDSPPPNCPVQSKFMGLMFVPWFIVQYQVWCSLRLHFLTLLEHWYMPSHNRFSVVTLRKWQKNGKRLAFVLVRIQHLIHIDFDSKLGLRGATPIEAVCLLKQKPHSKFVSPNWGFSLLALVHQRSKMVESYIRMT